MYRVLGITLISFLLGACAAGSGSTMNTAVGSQCKATCGQEKASCRGTSTTCERAAAACMANCQELEMLNRR